MKKGAHSHVNPDPLAVSLQVAPFSHGFGEQGDSERSNPNRRNKTNNIQDLVKSHVYECKMIIEVSGIQIAI